MSIEIKQTYKTHEVKKGKGLEKLFSIFLISYSFLENIYKYFSFFKSQLFNIQFKISLKYSKH